MSGSLIAQTGMDSQSDGTSLRNLGNGHGRESALQLFVQAKKRINDIFKDIDEYVVDAGKFVQGLSPELKGVGEEAIISPENAQVVVGFKVKIDGIREVLTRDHMKVVFFGRTSNGKSTVINAMLREKILPSGIGHTTHCFIQVEGSDNEEASMLTEDSNQPKSIQSLKQLASALSSGKLKENSLIRILWPKSKCRLLREDIVFLDSPGIDVSPDLDLWIDKFCLDADVFVLVANAESTLMQTEKNFFHKVSSRLSKPNVFVLQNRWDVSESEEDIDKVKQQHLDNNIQFLSEELQVADKREAKDRVFFVSARETLVSRLQDDTGIPTPDRALLPGFQARIFEFANFETKFEACISKSAVKTKFEQHTDRGKNITFELKKVMEDAFTSSNQHLERQQRLRQERLDELETLDKQLDLLSREVKAKIKVMVETVERKVASALNDEIRRLSLLVEEFDRPFHPDPRDLTAYKKDLHLFVEASICRNMIGRCTSSTQRQLDSMDLYLAERLATILPDDKRQQLFSLIPKRDFDIAYRLDCRNLCADFNEDIEFHFSLGPMNLMQKLLGSKDRANFLVGSAGTLGRTLSPGSTAIGTQQGLHDNEILASLLTTFASFTSRTTLGAVAVAGLLAKAAGWRVIAVTGALYGLLYLYERLTWTTRAKERCFKQQYVEYASSKLRLIVDLTSFNCSHQVQQELTSTFARLCHQADMTRQQLEESLKDMDKNLQQLQQVASASKTLRNKADFLDSELMSFCSQYLTQDS
ncbi:mitofusin-2-like isoform X2 [Pomacea canaliculata]|uniref:mitofusin-2-like isoform X2 n=1 Tax=Pomacea canaliculata TaxID=400727 RepID=UPI000D727F5D|nr:mitofusin-2-like isoform X2 [Pomacea canaliculata]